jgi:hypothetical protein
MFLGDRLKEVQNISKYHHFRVTSLKPGIVYMKVVADDTDEVYMKIVADDTDEVYMKVVLFVICKKWIKMNYRIKPGTNVRLFNFSK